MKEKIKKLFLKTASGIKPGLEITNNLLKNLNNPHKDYLTIHVAGTNGKGSIASYLEKILSLSGFKTGLYTSPHLYDFRERIRVNQEMIVKDSLLQLFDMVEKADTGIREATFFEFTTAMAFKHFSLQNVDIAVIETGMGGRFDSTNTISPVLSVITNVSMDHTDYLGNELRSIAGEKAGIIKPNIPVITGSSSDEVIDVIEKNSILNNSSLFAINRDFKIFKNGNINTCLTPFKNEYILNPRLEGEHQIINSSIAVSAADILNRFYPDIFDLTKENIEQGIKETFWRGRLEKISDEPEIIVDCAHNSHAASTLFNYLNKKKKNITLVFGSLHDKDYKETLSILEPLCDEIIFTNPDSERALEPEKLRRLVSVKSSIINNPVEAVVSAGKRAKRDDLICVAGSIYLSGLIIEAHDKGLI